MLHSWQCKMIQILCVGIKKISVLRILYKLSLFFWKTRLFEKISEVILDFHLKYGLHCTILLVSEIKPVEGQIIISSLCFHFIHFARRKHFFGLQGARWSITPLLGFVLTQMTCSLGSDRRCIATSSRVGGIPLRAEDVFMWGWWSKCLGKCWCMTSNLDRKVLHCLIIPIRDRGLGLYEYLISLPR